MGNLASNLEKKMKRIKSTVLCSFVLFAFAGCGNKLESAVDTWKAAACACKDKECAEKQKEAFNKIESDFRSEIKEMSKSDLKKVDAKLNEANKCLEEFEVHAG